MTARATTLSVLLFSGLIQFAGCQSPPAADPAIRAELIDRGERDQAMRSADVGAMSQEERRAFFTEAGEVGEANVAFLKEVIADEGWPTAERYGEEAADEAFLIVQHADDDPAFQAECLPLLEKEAQRGHVPMDQVAYLTDRVRVKQDRPQVYGTQYYVRQNERGRVVADENGNLTYLLPIVEEPGSLDERRAEAGLGPWTEYDQRMAVSQKREAADAPRSWDGTSPVDPQRHP